jgi:hypothetical protein
MFQWNLNMDGRVLDDEINCEQAEGSTFTMPTVDEDCTVLAFGFLDEADYCVDDILVDDVLDVVLCPVEGEEAHALDGVVVLRVPSCAVDDVGDLVEGQPFDVLSHWGCTCAMISSPMKMLSVILTGMDTSSGQELLSLCCMGLIYDCYIIKFVN